MSTPFQNVVLDKFSTAKLLERFVEHRFDLIDATIGETGFCTWDSVDLCEGARAVIEWFLSVQSKNFDTAQPFSMSTARKIEVAHRPIGGVAVILPQNASVYLGLLAGLSALATGNQVCLKLPTECKRSAKILHLLLDDLFEEQLEVLTTPGRQFMEWALSSREVDMIHFIGSSEVASRYLTPAFEAGKHFVVDGNGNCLVYVSDKCDVGRAAAMVAKGATRFNGQTCTSTNGVVVHPNRAHEFEMALCANLSEISFGDPYNPTNEVGELFSQQSVIETLGKIERSGGMISQGGVATEKCMAPTLVVDPRLNSDLVRDGVFAPVVWMLEGTIEDFEAVWSLNRYPLCAGLYSDSAEEQKQISNMLRLSRLTINGDTSLEDPMEPWGALPPSGNSKVEPWIDRYRRSIQFDLPRENEVKSGMGSAYFLE